MCSIILLLVLTEIDTTTTQTFSASVPSTTTTMQTFNPSTKKSQTTNLTATVIVPSQIPSSTTESTMDLSISTAESPDPVTTQIGIESTKLNVVV